MAWVNVMKKIFRPAKIAVALAAAAVLLAGGAALFLRPWEQAPGEPSPLPTPSATPVPTPVPTPVRFDGVPVGEATEELTLNSESDLPFLASLSGELPNLRRIEFDRRSPTSGELALLREAFPAAELHYAVKFGEESYPYDTRTLDLSALRRDGLEGALEAAACLPMLERIELGGETGEADSLTIADVKRFQELCPRADVAFSFTRFGKKLSTLDETLDFRGVQMSDQGAAVLEFLPCMTRCTSLDMDNCGVPDSVMASIREDYPRINVVWRVFFGRAFGCRTDAVRLMCSDGMTKLHSADLEAIRYCTSLRYLDLGHNSIEDLSFIENLPNLEVAILVDNLYTDISPLASLEKLEYLEIFETPVTDLTPLAGLENLRYLNICRCPEITDLTPLYGLTELKRLYIGRDDKKIPPEQLETIREKLPHTEINTFTWNPVLDGWREDERYDLLYEQMEYDRGFDYYWVP